MAVMAKWRNKTFEVSRKKVNPLKNFSTSTTIKGDDSKSKKKKTELVPFTFDIDVHANAGVNPQKEYESWCSLTLWTFCSLNRRTEPKFCGNGIRSTT